jgi:hypothetical protein
MIRTLTISVICFSLTWMNNSIQAQSRSSVHYPCGSSTYNAPSTSSSSHSSSGSYSAPSQNTSTYSSSHTSCGYSTSHCSGGTNSSNHSCSTTSGSQKKCNNGVQHVSIYNDAEPGPVYLTKKDRRVNRIVDAFAIAGAVFFMWLYHSKNTVNP